MKDQSFFITKLKQMKRAGGLTDAEISRATGLSEDYIVRFLNGRKKSIIWRDLVALLDYFSDKPWGLQSPEETVAWAEAAGHKLTMKLLRRLFSTARVPLIFYLPLRLPAYYVARPAQEQIIAQELEAPQPVVLVGQPGTGKSLLMAALANQLWAYRFPAGVLHIGMTGLRDVHDLLTVLGPQLEEMMICSGQQLRSLFYSQPYLVCLDDVTPEHTWLAEWLPPGGQSRYLVATRHQIVADRLEGVTIHIGPFTEEESLKFLNWRAEQDLRATSWARTLCQQAGYLPAVLKVIRERLETGTNGEQLLSLVTRVRQMGVWQPGEGTSLLRDLLLKADSQTAEQAIVATPVISALSPQEPGQDWCLWPILDYQQPFWQNWFQLGHTLLKYRHLVELSSVILVLTFSGSAFIGAGYTLFNPTLGWEIRFELSQLVALPVLLPAIIGWGVGEGVAKLTGQIPASGEKE